MMPSPVVRLGSEYLDTEYGGWCEDCKLPSLISASIAWTLDGKPQGVFTISRCDECGRTSPDVIDLR